MKYLLLSLLFPFLAFGAPRYWGIDHLGGAKYADVMIRNHPKGYAAGIFTNTFGDAAPAITKLLATGNVPLMRYNLKWSDTHTFSVKDFPGIVKEAKKYAALTDKFPSVECQFSGATEHNLNLKDATALAKKVLEVIPERCIYVNQPLPSKGGAWLPAGPRIINETHGSKAATPKGRYNFSFDGEDAFDVNVTKVKNAHANADVFFMWTSQCNGRRNRNDDTPRPLRKFYPTGKLIRALAFLSTEQGTVKLPRNYLVKPKSDQHEVPPEERALKPVFLFKGPEAKVQLKVGHTTIATSSPGMPFADGRKRYYFPLFGYEIVKKAGTNVLDLYVNNKKVGTVNPAFRQGN